MGLDAWVHCDCFEKGKLLSPPPSDDRLYIDDYGSLNIASDDLDRQIAFDTWCIERACVHHDMQLVHHRIGNISHVVELRVTLSMLTKACDIDFPMIAQKVVHDGVHSGDKISVDAVGALGGEVRVLGVVLEGYDDSVDKLRHLRQQLAELVEAALSVGKPIVF